MRFGKLLQRVGGRCEPMLSQIAVSRLSRAPEWAIGPGREPRQPRYHGYALDRAQMSGRVCGNPGGTAI